MTKPTASIALPQSDPLFAEMLNDADAAVGLAEAARLLRENYCLIGELANLPGERDRNFLVAVAGDPQFVLKISGPNELTAVTDLQLAVLRWLVTSACDLSLPQLQPTVSGDDHVAFTDPIGRPRIARLLSYVSGQPLRAKPLFPARALRSRADQQQAYHRARWLRPSGRS